jgi:DNA polymerase III epsilon subunit family exonuclease
VPASAVPIRQAIFAVLDVETTGLEPHARVIEIACVRLQGFRELGRLQSLIHPGIPIPPVATSVSGIDDAMVSGAPPFSQVWPALANLLEDAVLVAHNAPFDLHYLSNEKKRAGGSPWQGPVLDTLRLARNVLELPAYSLPELRASLALESGPSHRALADVLTTAALLKLLVERLAPGVRTLPELLQAQLPVPLPWEEATRFGVPEPTVETLADAARRGQWVAIDYESRAGTRRWLLHPLGLERNGRLTYLLGQVEPTRETRTFRTDRIRGASLALPPQPGNPTA